VGFWGFLSKKHRNMWKNPGFQPFSFDRQKSGRHTSPVTIRFTPGSPTNREEAPMNKNDLIAKVADLSEMTKGDATKAVDSIIDAVTQALQAGDEVRLVGFGTFSVSHRKATMGRNPRTGEPMQIPASMQPKFKAGKGLKDAVN
jgi:DNA-binding protein HU-beta